MTDDADRTDLDDELDEEVDDDDDFDDADDEVDDDDDVDDDLEHDPNLVKGATAISVLEHVVTSIVEDPDAVEIDADERSRGVTLRVHVAPDDMGRVIGKRGRTAHAIRTVVRAAASRDGVEADVDFVE